MKLGEVMGEVMDVGVYEMLNKTIIVKVRVDLKMDSPIITNMYIGSNNNRVSWIEFRYERLLMVCFYCGYMGHSEEHYFNMIPANHGIPEVNPFGPWMKASQTSRK